MNKQQINNNFSFKTTGQSAQQAKQTFSVNFHINFLQFKPRALIFFYIKNIFSILKYLT